MNGPRHLTANFLLRLTPAQRHRWEAAAADAGRSLSDWVRRACDAEARRQAEGVTAVQYDTAVTRKPRQR